MRLEYQGVISCVACVIKGDETKVSECDQLWHVLSRVMRLEYQSVTSCVACVIKGDETRVSECDQLCGMCYQG